MVTLENAQHQPTALQDVVRTQMASFLVWAVRNDLANAHHQERRERLFAHPGLYIRIECDDALTTRDFQRAASAFVADVYRWERTDDGWNFSGLDRRLAEARPFRSRASVTDTRSLAIGTLVRHSEYGMGTVRVFRPGKRFGVRFEGRTRSVDVPGSALEPVSLRALFLEAAHADPAYAVDPRPATAALGAFLKWSSGKSLLARHHRGAWEPIHADPVTYILTECGGALGLEDFDDNAHALVARAMPRYGETARIDDFERHLRRCPIPRRR